MVVPCGIPFWRGIPIKASRVRGWVKGGLGGKRATREAMGKWNERCGLVLIGTYIIVGIAAFSEVRWLQGVGVLIMIATLVVLINIPDGK